MLAPDPPPRCAVQQLHHSGVQLTQGLISSGLRRWALPAGCGTLASRAGCPSTQRQPCAARGRHRSAHLWVMHMGVCMRHFAVSMVIYLQVSSMNPIIQLYSERNLIRSRICPRGNEGRRVRNQEE
eukprot:1160611-Pelagomonas_calceolata.AAC.10